MPWWLMAPVDCLTAATREACHGIASIQMHSRADGRRDSAVTKPPHDLVGRREDQPPLAGDSPTGSSGVRLGGWEGDVSSRRPRLAGSSPSDGGGPFSSLLFEEAQAAAAIREQDEDRSFAADLNLDQIVAAIAGDREEHDLITTVLFGTSPRCRCRALPAGGLSGPGGPCPARCRSSVSPASCVRYAPTSASWRRCGTATSVRAGSWTRRPSTATRCTPWPGTRLGADQLPRPAGLPGVPRRLCGLGRVHRPGGRYTEPQGRPRADPLLHPHPRRPGRREPLPGRSRLQRRGVCKTFERFKQGAVKDYRIRYRTLAGDEPRRRPDPRAGGQAVPGGVHRPGRVLPPARRVPR